MARRVDENAQIFGFDDGECRVLIAGGQQYIVFPSYACNKEGVDYVRFVDVVTGKELLYYVFDEWVEEPQSVMGVIMACIQNGASREVPINATMNGRRSSA